MKPKMVYSPEQEGYSQPLRPGYIATRTEEHVQAKTNPPTRPLRAMARHQGSVIHASQKKNAVQMLFFKDDAVCNKGKIVVVASAIAPAMIAN